MARRKKKKNSFGWVIAGLAVGIFGWIAMDFYFNIYRHPQQKETDVENVQSQESAVIDQAEPAGENAAPEPEDGFTMAVYRDDRYGVEFAYPTIAGDVRCPIPEKSGEGFSLGQFYFFSGQTGESMEDFMARQMEGLQIENQEIINIGIAQLQAIKVDYQTSGMGWYGSSVFAKNSGRVFEFGLLANEMLEKCGGARDYDDRIYQSVISTLKFVD